MISFLLFIFILSSFGAKIAEISSSLSDDEDIFATIAPNEHHLDRKALGLSDIDRILYYYKYLFIIIFIIIIFIFIILLFLLFEKIKNFFQRNFLFFQRVFNYLFN
jgi:amino acid transporter